MALKDLQTNLKSLQYPSKGTPLIDRVSFDGDNVGGNPTFIIGEDHSSSGIGSNQVDSIFRGGFKTHFNRASIDFQRTKRYLFPKIDFDIGELPSIDFGTNMLSPGVDFQPGRWPKLDISVPQFVQRQIGLQLMNPKISAPMGGLIDTAPANQRTFNPVSLAAQIFLSGTGIHIKREGLQPFNNRGYINNTRFDPSLSQDPTGDILGVDITTSGDYAADAELRMIYLKNRLAAYENIVADYYIRSGAYVAALNRSKDALEKYNGVPSNEESLQIMLKAYQALGMTDLANDTRSVLINNYGSSQETLNSSQNTFIGPQERLNNSQDIFIGHQETLNNSQDIFIGPQERLNSSQDTLISAQEEASENKQNDQPQKEVPNFWQRIKGLLPKTPNRNK